VQQIKLVIAKIVFTGSGKSVELKDGGVSEVSKKEGIAEC
jgi:hypothetical protein